MKWIGLTGGMGTGKSTVAKRLRDLGFLVLDADQLAREVVNPRSSAWTKVVNHFGAEILNPDQTINRVQLAQIVFQNAESLKNLEEIIHPEIKMRVRELKLAAQKNGAMIAFYDVPLLFEKGMEQEFDQVVVVTCPLDLQLKRILERDNLKAPDVLLRLKQQLSLEEKTKRAHYVLENSGSLEDLYQKIDHLLKQLLP